MINNFKRNWEYLKVNLFILKKQVFEYKVNFWIDFSSQILFLSLGIFFLYLWQINFGDVIGWTFLDFILFFTSIDTIWCLAGIFFWKGNLFNAITRGELNNSLIRPLNPFFAENFGKLELTGLTMTLMNIPILVLIFSQMEIEIINYFKFIFSSLALTIFYITFHYFIHSIEFYFKRSSSLLRKVSFEIHNTLSSYPFQFFQKFNFKYLLMFIPTLYVGSLLIPIVKGTEIWNLELQLLILFSLNLLFSVGTWINWKFGLRKYEAFG